MSKAMAQLKMGGAADTSYGADFPKKDIQRLNKASFKDGEQLNSI